MNLVFKNIKNFIAQFPFFLNLYKNLKSNNYDLIYKPEDLNDNYYNRIKNLEDTELEHQIGRLSNFKKILQEIDRDKIKGDIIEFGTWQGFSLLWIAYLSERLSILNKKIIGIDGFIGLPNSEGSFKKGDFKDTSFKVCKNNIYQNKNLYALTKKKIFIEKFLYSQKQAIAQRLKQIGGQNFCFIHLDSDLSSSTHQIFNILIENNLLNQECYLLFDDYGCKSNLKETVNNILSKMQKEWEIKEHSSTVLTKNFKLKRYGTT